MPDNEVRPVRLTPEVIRDLVHTMEANDPVRWRRCYPRIYSDVKGDYYSPKIPALQMLQACKRAEAGYLGEAEQTEIAWGSCLLEKQVPMYWIAKDMALAIRETIPPMELAWAEMKLPFEDAVFMLPKGVLQHDDSDEGDIAFVSYTRCRRYRQVANMSRVEPQVIAFGGNFTVYAFTYPGGHFLHWNIPQDDQPVIQLAELDNLLQEFSDPKWEHRSGYLYSPHMTPEDNKTMIKVLHMVFGILLFMLRRKDLVTEPKLIKRIPSKGLNEPAREFWSPGVLGEHYRIKRQVEALGGTHASPRTHWCRGHWKDQHYGPKNSLVKEAWIEPYLRGVDLAE